MHRRVHDGFLVGLAAVELLDDAALPAHQNAVGELKDLRQVGGDDHDRDAVVGERG